MSGPITYPNSGGGSSSNNNTTSIPKRVSGLQKQKSWSPDLEREEAWIRRMGIHRDRRGPLDRSRSLTDDDIDELRGCMDLGFGFDGCQPGMGRLSETFPALDLYHAVHRSCCAGKESPATSDESPVDSPISILSPGDTPEMVKGKLKQWAQVVACSVRNRC